MDALIATGVSPLIYCWTRILLQTTELNPSGKSHHSALTTPSWRAGPLIGRPANKSWWPSEVTGQDQSKHECLLKNEWVPCETNCMQNNATAVHSWYCISHVASHPNRSDLQVPVYAVRYGRTAGCILRGSLWQWMQTWKCECVRTGSYAQTQNDMYRCVYVHLSIYLSVYMYYSYLHSFLHLTVYWYAFLWKCIEPTYIHTYMHTCMHTYRPMYVMYVRKYTNKCTHTHTMQNIHKAESMSERVP